MRMQSAMFWRSMSSNLYNPTRVEKHEDLKGYYLFDKIFEVVEDVMFDGVMDVDEKRILLNALDAFINPHTEKSEIAKNVIENFFFKTER